LIILVQAAFGYYPDAAFFVTCYTTHMKIYFATDHAGYELKEVLVPYVKQLGFEVEDCGAHGYDPEDDYPDYIAKAARKVSENPQKTLGIILGGSGEGEAMVANKFAHVRATAYYGGNPEIITLSREHNDANMLSLGAMFLDVYEAKRAVKQWLLGHYSLADRHKRRIEKIEDIKINSKSLWQRLFRQ
jgi:ribose 5-phosphate isomerase B